MTNFFKAFKQFKPSVRIEEFYVYYDRTTGQVLEFSHEKKDMASIKITREQRISLNSHAIHDLFVKKDKVCIRPRPKIAKQRYSRLLEVDVDHYGYRFEDNNISWPKDKRKGSGKNFLYGQD